MKQEKHLLVLAFSVIIIFASCSKHDSSIPSKTYTPLNNGLYVLNEGPFQGNGAALTYYDSASKVATTDIYSNINDSLLGDTGNDILIYGSKLYVVMNVSSNITVIDKRTCQSLKQIKTANGSKWQPRFIIPSNGKLLVSAYDGTVSVIDTTSLTITNTVNVGAYPDGLSVSGNNLFVANSGELNLVPDSTVSVVDLNTFKETKKIKLGKSPQKIVTDSKGNVYVFTWGYTDYSSGSAVVITLPKVYKIDANSQTVTDSSSALTVGDKMIIYNDVLYFDGNSNQPVYTLNTNNLHSSLTNFISDGTTLGHPYGINIDPANGYIYVTDANSTYSGQGKVYCFDETGKLKLYFDAGILPDKVVFLR